MIEYICKNKNSNKIKRRFSLASNVSKSPEHSYKTNKNEFLSASISSYHSINTNQSKTFKNSAENFDLTLNEIEYLTLCNLNQIKTSSIDLNFECSRNDGYFLDRKLSDLSLINTETIETNIGIENNEILSTSHEASESSREDEINTVKVKDSLELVKMDKTINTFDTRPISFQTSARRQRDCTKKAKSSQSNVRLKAPLLKNKLYSSMMTINKGALNIKKKPLYRPNEKMLERKSDNLVDKCENFNDLNKNDRFLFEIENSLKKITENLNIFRKNKNSPSEIELMHLNDVTEEKSLLEQYLFQLDWTFASDEHLINNDSYLKLKKRYNLIRYFLEGVKCRNCGSIALINDISV